MGSKACLCLTKTFSENESTSNSAILICTSGDSRTERLGAASVSAATAGVTGGPGLAIAASSLATVSRLRRTVRSGTVTLPVLSFAAVSGLASPNWARRGATAAASSGAGVKPVVTTSVSFSDSSGPEIWPTTSTFISKARACVCCAAFSPSASRGLGPTTAVCSVSVRPLNCLR